MIRPFVFCVSAAGFVLVLATLYAGNIEGPPRPVDDYYQALYDLVGELRDPDPKTRSRVHSHLADIHSAVVGRLLAIAREPDPDLPLGSPELHAIQLLGEWRAIEARDLLVKHVECTSLESPRSLGRRLREFPAVEALVAIGSPSAEYITQWLMNDTHPSDWRLRLFAFVIYSTDREAVGLARLRAAMEEIKKRKDDPRYHSLGDVPEQNLSRMIKMFRSIDFSDPRQWPRLPVRPAPER